MLHRNARNAEGYCLLPLKHWKCSERCATWWRGQAAASCGRRKGARRATSPSATAQSHQQHMPHDSHAIGAWGNTCKPSIRRQPTYCHCQNLPQRTAALSEC
eukprot:2994682-Alexandrium_andersonii.AAC.1